MHIKTALEMLNAIEKVETTDLNGKHLKRVLQHNIIADFAIYFPDLDVFYNSGGKWTSGCGN